VRELQAFERLAQWNGSNLPPEQPTALFHGDFHLDNCLMTPGPPIAVAGIIDWEMASIGDPLVDLGLLLAFWGDERPAEPAIPWVQAVTRSAGAPARRELAERYALRSGRSVEAIDWYMAFAFWKLAAIVEGAYAQHVHGMLDTAYARELETDVPRLLSEAAAIAGLA
jgi:aminoglycoside phosphotransferase (APT) family kinase protein